MSHSVFKKLNLLYVGVHERPGMCLPASVETIIDTNGQNAAPIKDTMPIRAWILVGLSVVGDATKLSFFFMLPSAVVILSLYTLR